VVLKGSAIPGDLGSWRQKFWGIASLFDAYHVPKLLSQQLLPFGRSGDGLEELTRGVELFLPLSVRRGLSARHTTDSPRVACSSRVRRVRARLRFRSGFVLGFRCSWFVDGPSFSSGQSDPARTVRLVFADGPFFLGSFLVILLDLTDCPRHLAGWSAWPLQTVRGS
jgi:hypothetical protein